MPESAAVTARTDFGMQIPQQARDRHMLQSGDVPARVVTHIFDLQTLLDTAPLGMLDSGAARPNVVITCAAAEMPTVVARLQQMAVQPVHTCTVDQDPRWPVLTGGTLIVHDLAQLNMASQIELYDWMSQRVGTTQVIGLTTAPLAPLVERGQFLQALFCRLNVLQAVSTPAPATLARSAASQ